MADSPVDDPVSRLGSRIRAERVDRGLSVTELSERSGVGRGTVADLERTARTPSLDTLAKIASGLGVPMPALLDERLTERPLAPFGPGTGVDARVLGVWVEDDVQVEVYRLVLHEPLRRGRGRRGSRGYLTVLAGRLSAGSAATPRRLGVGGQLAYATDQPHVLAPIGGPAQVILVMRYPLQREPGPGAGPDDQSGDQPDGRPDDQPGRSDASRGTVPRTR